MVTPTFIQKFDQATTPPQNIANKGNAHNGNKQANAHKETHVHSKPRILKNFDFRLKPDKDPNPVNVTKGKTAKTSNDKESPITVINETEIMPTNNAIIVTTAKEDMQTIATATTDTTTTETEITTTDTTIIGTNTTNDQDLPHQTDRIDNPPQDDVYHNMTTDAITSHTTIDET